MCGCGNKGIRGAGRNPVMAPRNNVTIQNTRKQIKTQAVSPPTNNGLTTDRRAAERQRREAILKKLGKL